MTKILFGGSDQSSSNSSKSGYSALPKALQAAFNPMGEAVAQFTNPNNPGVTAAFTPTPLTGAENSAVSNVNAGFSPTASSVASDMALQDNPYMSHVIDAVNRNSQGDYSVMKQALNSAGLGPDSNRSILGANDIQQTNDMTIGNLLSSQFNTEMNNALTTLPQERAADSSNQLSVGNMLRQLAMQKAQAPVTALQAGTGMIAPFTAGGTSSGSSSGSQQNGIFKSIGL